MWLSLLLSIASTITIIHIIPHVNTIYDLGHHLIPKIKETKLPEYHIMAQLLFHIIYVQDIYNLGNCISTFYWFRFSTVCLTILPSLRKYRHIEFGGFAGGHNDYLPVSGHVGLLHLLNLFLYPYIGNLMYLSSFYMIYNLTAMRRHYTIELVMSILVTEHIYKTVV